VGSTLNPLFLLFRVHVSLINYSDRHVAMIYVIPMFRVGQFGDSIIALKHWSNVRISDLGIRAYIL
jgi:hypothetical protein